MESFFDLKFKNISFQTASLRVIFFSVQIAGTSNSMETSAKDNVRVDSAQNQVVAKETFVQRLIQ